MSDNFFRRERTMNHQFFILGLTGDEFFSDGGLKLNIEQLVHMELKQSGYERIVFYDDIKKLYCYDDDSFKLLVGAGRACTRARRRSYGGLKMGSFTPQNDTPRDEQQQSAPETTNSRWQTGKRSGIRILNSDETRLHLGVRDDAAVWQQIDSYITDHTVKTAVVINDATIFWERFNGIARHKLLTEYERLNTDNRNILVFLYADQKMDHLYEINPHKPEDPDVETNVLDITGPNAVEVRNMLMFLRLNHGLRFHMRDLDKLCIAFCQALSLSKRRIKEGYILLQDFDNKSYLDENACYQILGVSKPKTALEQLDEMIGMQPLKDKIRSFHVNGNVQLETLRYQLASRLKPDPDNPYKADEMIHIILTGNPGVGKTTAAKLLGQAFYEMGYLKKGHVVETTRVDLVDSIVGGTAIKTRRKVEEAMGGILFIDEAYSLKREKNGSGADFGQECIDTLCKLMDQYKGQFIVVAAGYEKDMEIFLSANRGMASRFNVKISIDDYTPEEMHQILLFHLQKNKAVLSDELEASMKDFCDNWVHQAKKDWGNGREAVNLVDGMIRAWKNDPKHQTVTDENGTKLAVMQSSYIPTEMKDFLRPAKEVREEVLRELHAMTGLDSVKERIERLRLEMIGAAKLNVDSIEPGHYLFVGNPGTGKTTVARIMGKVLHNVGALKRGHTIEYTASSLIAKVFDDENKGDIYQVAKEAFGGVLFIDEAYQLTTTDRGMIILNALLPFMENYRKDVCVILAGYEEEIGKLLKTNIGFNSRFQPTIFFENYTGAELRDILLKMLAEQGITADEEYQELALRALTRYVEIYGKEKTFGNARYLREVFMMDSLHEQNMRLVKHYGEDYAPELKKTLIAEDIPAAMKRWTKQPVSKPDTRSAIEIIDSLVGYEKVKEELHRIIKNSRFNQENEMGISGMEQRMHWVLMGNPGTGKTTIARLIGKVYKECGILSKGHTVEVTRADLVACYEGQTAEKTESVIQKALGGVLFVDEAYSLVTSEVNGGGFGAEAIAQLIKRMEDYNGEFAVVLAGYPEEMRDFIKSNPGIFSRVKTMELPDYTPKELVQIFLQKSKENKAVPEQELLDKLELLFYNKKQRESKSNGRDWGNGRVVENLLRDMLTNWLSNQVYNEEKNMRILTIDHIPEDEKIYLHGKLPEYKETSAIEEINNLIGFSALKTKLIDMMNLKKVADKTNNPMLAEGINFHWVLEGNPGTGKTTVAKLIGRVYKEMGMLKRGHTVKVTRTDLVGQYIGETAQKTQKCIDRAAGGILFIDEAYTLKRSGIGNERDFGQEAIDTILEQMTDRNGDFAVIVAGYPREMEVFLDSNPGLRLRFAETFRLDDYNAFELTQIFETKCRKNGFLLTDDFKLLIEGMFRNLIDAKIKGWANGREAEKLEMSMRMEWARNYTKSVQQDANASREQIYTIDDIPSEYKKYLPSENRAADITEPVAEEPEKPNREQTDKYVLPANLLEPLPKIFDYEKTYLLQTQSVVYIIARDGEYVSTGSGSIITKEGHILTCNHVIENTENIVVRIKPNGNESEKTEWLDAKVVWRDVQRDFALLKIHAGNYQALSLRPVNTNTLPGEELYLWGYPFGRRLNDDVNLLQPSLFKGSVSSIQTKGGIERINADIRATVGCSGGPVLSKNDGSIVGILCGAQISRQDDHKEEINFICPVRYLWESIISDDIA